MASGAVSAGHEAPQPLLVIGEKSSGESCGQARAARAITREVERGSQVAVAPPSFQEEGKGEKRD